MDEIAATTPTFAGVSFARLDAVGQHAMAVQRQGTARHADRCTSANSSVARASFIPTIYVPTTESTSRRYPLILTTGRILTQYNVGAQTRRTANVTWHPEDVLEIHPPTPRCGASAAATASS